jgi:hypothetical protein
MHIFKQNSENYFTQFAHGVRMSVVQVMKTPAVCVMAMAAFCLIYEKHFCSKLPDLDYIEISATTLKNPL